MPHKNCLQTVFGCRSSSRNKIINRHRGKIHYSTSSSSVQKLETNLQASFQCLFAQNVFLTNSGSKIINLRYFLFKTLNPKRNWKSFVICGSLRSNLDFLETTKCFVNMGKEKFRRNKRGNEVYLKPHLNVCLAAFVSHQFPHCVLSYDSDLH